MTAIKTALLVIEVIVRAIMRRGFAYLCNCHILQDIKCAIICQKLWQITHRRRSGKRGSVMTKIPFMHRPCLLCLCDKGAKLWLFAGEKLCPMIKGCAIVAFCTASATNSSALINHKHRFPILDAISCGGKARYA